jgi:hypothetical protein
MKRSTDQNPLRKPRSRLGCLGSLLAFLVLGSVTYLLILAVFAPWSFFLGGNFHLIPGWQGWGTLHARSGNFTLYVLLSRPQETKQGYPYISGIAELCTPRGERFTFMKATAYFHNKGFGLNSDKQPVTLSIYNYGLFGRFNIDMDYRPEFDLYGSWHNPNLVLEDHGSLARAFLPDGQAYLGSKNKQPPAGDNLSLTLAPGNYWDFDAACRRAH